ncbi:MAG: phage holin family protein [Burkholderiales bacterium]
MDSEQPGPGLRLMDSLKAAFATLLAIAQTRLELLGVELQGQLYDGARFLLWGIAAIALAALGIGMLCMVLLIAFWDEHRLLVAALLAAGFLTASAVAFLALRQTLARKANPFSATLHELTKDQGELRSR